MTKCKGILHHGEQLRPTTVCDIAVVFCCEVLWIFTYICLSCFTGIGAIVIPALVKQLWWIWARSQLLPFLTEITQSTTKPSAYPMGYTATNTYWKWESRAPNPIFIGVNHRGKSSTMAKLLRCIVSIFKRKQHIHDVYYFTVHVNYIWIASSIVLKYNVPFPIWRLHWDHWQMYTWSLDIEGQWCPR